MRKILNPFSRSREKGVHLHSEANVTILSPGEGEGKMLWQRT